MMTHAAGLPPMTAGEALDYLHGLFRPGAPAAPGLDRITGLLHRLGNPQEGLKTVHITGTNGKGSVAATVASICRAAGLRTGLFISPYLERFGERVQLDGVELPDEWLAGLMPVVRAAIEEMARDGLAAPTEFEAVTALAALYYRRRKAEIVALEAGMGGRNDATNAIPGSLVSVITTVGLDHTERLGPTIADIAREKAGIIRPGGTIVTGNLRPEAMAVVAQAAEERGARHLTLGRDFNCAVEESSQRGIVVSVSGLERRYRSLRFPLLGRHQAGNVAVAVTAAECAASRGGLAISEEAVLRGVETTRWPGRSEVISREPLVVIDGAHNPDAIAALAATLTEVFPGRKIAGVLGAMGDKALMAMFGHLAPLLAQAIVTMPPFAPRAMPAGELAEMLRDRFGGGGLAVQATPDLGEALAQGLQTVRSGRCDLLLVTGSFYLVGAARTILRDTLCPDHAESAGAVPR